MKWMIRVALTVFIWLTTIGAFLGSLAIVSNSSGITGIFVPISIFLFGAAIMLNGFIWQWGQQLKEEEGSSQAEKAKRDTKIRDMLQRLSDEELLSLREELTDRQVQGIGEDGELVYQERRR